MTSSPAREWRCDTCGAVEIQTGPRALELIPTPPHGWAVVDTTRILPARTVGEGEGRQKIGETRETKRKSFCTACSVEK